MDPSSISAKRIFIAPLNWGLGHASRTAHLINLLKVHNEIILGADGKALDWLQKEFPDMKTIALPSLNMRYSKLFGASVGVLLRSGRFIRSIKKDYHALAKILESEDVDLVISDNRYGIYNEGVHSILVTHQLNIISPLSSILSLSIQTWVDKFDEIWIPDLPDRSLSGDLSRPLFKLTKDLEFIGPLSRFSKNDRVEKDIKFTLIASGLEPFRTQLIEYFYHNFNLIEESCCIVCGGKFAFDKENNKVLIIENPSSSELEQIIDRSTYVLCRSGYSSIMDLIIKEQAAILIPTPGQPEQLYLAKIHNNNPLFRAVLKDEDLPLIMKELR
jgi:hypothetical protein